MPDSQQVDQLIRDGVAAIRAGDRDAGRVALARALALDQHDITAWLWLGCAVDTPEQAAFCFEKALALDPDNAYARERLADVADEFPVLPALLPLPPGPEPEPAPEIEPAPGPTPPVAMPLIEVDRSAFPEVGLASSTEWAPAEWTAPEGEPAETAESEPVADESWRDELFADAEPPPPPAETAPAAEAEPLVEPAAGAPIEAGDGEALDILDLVDAWGNAVILRVAGAYRSVVDAARGGQTALGFLFAALLLTISSFLFIRLVIAPFGVEALLAELSAVPEVDAAALAGVFNRLGVVAPLLALGAVVGRLLFGAVTHFVASMFRGEGTASRVFSAIGLATVGQGVLTIVAAFVLLVASLAGLSSGVVLFVAPLLTLLVAIYTFVADTVAVRTAHPRLTTGAAIGTVVMTSLVISSVACCLSFTLASLGAA